VEELESGFLRKRLPRDKVIDLQRCDWFFTLLSYLHVYIKITFTSCNKLRNVRKNYMKKNWSKQFPIKVY